MACLASQAREGHGERLVVVTQWCCWAPPDERGHPGAPGVPLALAQQTQAETVGERRHESGGCQPPRCPSAVPLAVRDLQTPQRAEGVLAAWPHVAVRHRRS